jgi:cyclase
LLRPRLIPQLLIDKSQLIKTKKFANPQYIGDPLNAIKIFNEKEVDEIIVVDRSATNEGINLSLVKNMASQCFMPLTYGGGINNIDAVDKVMKLGVEKIIIRTSLFENKGIISDIKRKYGSQSMIACMDIRKDFFGNYRILNTKIINKAIVNFVNEIILLGVGEIMIQSVDFEGTCNGIDRDLILFFSSVNNVPVIYTGGVRGIEDVRLGLNLGMHSIAAGSMFLFKGPKKGILINYPNNKIIDSLG